VTRRVFRPGFAPVLAVLAGAATVAGFAPFGLFPLPVVTLATLGVLALRARTPRSAFALGFVFGLGMFLAGVSWVYVSLHDFGAMPAPLAALATLLFCAVLALFPAGAAWACRRAAARPALAVALVLPGAWVLLEWLRGWILTGFPWLALGYSQIPSSPLAGYAPVAGIYGVSLAVALSAGALAALFVSGRRGPALLAHPAPAALTALWLAGHILLQVQWTAPSGAPLKVSLLQGNVAQDLKWREERVRPTLERYLELARASDGRLVVLPETALPLFLGDVPADYLVALGATARERNGDLLVGVPERPARREYYNSVISLGAAPPQTYRKVHLVPFGEFIPFRPVLEWIVNVLAIPLSDFTRGSPDQRPLAVAGERVAVNICYEDAFGEEIIRQLPEATLLVNVSNVAWFGRSIAPRQHLQISQARALETGRYMLRSTNTGVTAIVDPRGRVVRAAPEFETAIVSGEVRGHAGATPYVRLGNLPAILLALALTAIGALAAGARFARPPSNR